MTHGTLDLKSMRNFTNAVLEYTGADKVDIIAHGMGVTLARRVIKGGVVKATFDYPFDLGPPLTDKVDTFIGIAGANYGVADCLDY